MPPPSERGAFYFSLLKTLAGEHYPRINFHPVSLISIWFLAFFVIAIVLKVISDFIKKKRTDSFFVKCLVIILISLSFAEVFSSFVLSIRLGRYFIFFLGPLILCFVSLWGKHRFSSLISLPFLVLLLVLNNPMIFYLGEREAFNYYSEVKRREPEINLVFCANKFQYAYYLKTAQEHCDEQYSKMKNDSLEFVFVDMNGNGREVLSKIINDYEVVDFRAAGIHASGIARKKTDKGQFSDSRQYKHSDGVK